VPRPDALVQHGPARTPAPARRADGADGAVDPADPAEIARRLAPSLHWPGAEALTRRSWRRVAWTAEFDAWLIAWPEGGEIDLHDHGDSRGVLSVIDGVLTEFVPQWDGTGCLGLQRLELWAGTTHRLGGGHVHSITNESERHALSLHVYSPALSSMTFFDLAGDDLVARADPWRAEDEDGLLVGWPDPASAGRAGPR